MRYMSYLKQLIRENVQTATVLFRNWYQGLLESGRGSQFFWRIADSDLLAEK